MSIIRNFLAWLSGSTGHTNISDKSAPMAWPEAEKVMLAGGKVRNVLDKGIGRFIEWDAIDKVFREGVAGSKTRTLYIPEADMQGQTSVVWVITGGV